MFGQMIFTIAGADDATIATAVGAGYYIRRRRWMMAAVLAFLLLGAL